MFRLDRSRHGGGVLIYVKAVFTCSVLFKGTTDFECVILSVLCISHTPSPDLTIALFYRHPSANSCVLDNLFSTLCKLDLYPTYDVDQSTVNVYICGIVLWLGQYHDIALW